MPHNSIRRPPDYISYIRMRDIKKKAWCVNEIRYRSARGLPFIGSHPTIKFSAMITLQFLHEKSTTFLLLQDEMVIILGGLTCNTE